MNDVVVVTDESFKSVNGLAINILEGRIRELSDDINSEWCNKDTYEIKVELTKIMRDQIIELEGTLKVLGRIKVADE